MPIPNNETRFFQLQIRTGSLTGPVQITSNVITVVDGAQAFVNATGGMVYIDNGFKTHVFTKSNNFVISGLGLPANRNLYYEIVAGGGAGGYNNPQGSGGGGAGGYLRGNVTLDSTGTFAITVGGGAGGLYNGGYVVGGRGSNSSIFGNTYVAVGGGNGATPSPSSGVPGGSGGGADFYSTTVGTGIPGQGNPGGGDASSSRGGGGGGAGEAGTGYPVGARGGNGLSSVSISGIPSVSQPLYGTPSYGPQSGRWLAGGGQGARGGPLDRSGPNSPGLHSAGGGGRAGEPGIADGQPGKTNTGGGGGAADSGPGSGAGGSGIVIIRYPYTIATYNLNDNLGSARATIDNSNVVYSLVTVNVSNATILYWTLSGNVLNGDVVGGNTGSFAVVNSNATFRVNLANNIVTGSATKNYTLQLRSSSVAGPIVATSNTIVVNNSNDPGTYISATGGNVSISGGYKIHVFESSNNFVVSSAGRLGGVVEYVLVAGGGGGGPNGGPAQGGGGGGGAGGLVTGTTTISAQTYVANVGAGGTTSAPTATPGANTDIFSIVAVGGGRGGVQNNGTIGPAGNGGSGGGAQYNNYGTPTYWGGGLGYPGQGSNGGRADYRNPPYGGGAGGGGAGGGGGNAGLYVPEGRGGSGLPITWVPSLYGQTGPAPGRYFAGGGGAGSGAPPDGTNEGRQGGAGGGGAGGPGTANPSIPAGTGVFAGNVNMGGGGGGAGMNNAAGVGGGQGGSGIIIIRYPFV